MQIFDGEAKDKNHLYLLSDSGIYDKLSIETLEEDINNYVVSDNSDIDDLFEECANKITSKLEEAYSEIMQTDYSKMVDLNKFKHDQHSFKEAIESFGDLIKKSFDKDSDSDE